MPPRDCRRRLAGDDLRSEIPLRTGRARQRARDLVFDFEPADDERRIEGWLSGAVADPTVGFTAEELAAHVRTEFSTLQLVVRGKSSNASV
jgi:hypothetical protein